jgi:hypothetical protein
MDETRGTSEVTAKVEARGRAVQLSIANSGQPGAPRFWGLGVKFQSSGLGGALMCSCDPVADAVIGSQIDLLVFDAAPQPLDKDVVGPSSFAVHADCNLIVGERAGEGRASELRSLVGVEDIWFAVTSQCILQRFDAECRLHRDRQSPRQHPAAEPVEHHGQIDEAARHRDIGDVHRPRRALREFSTSTPGPRPTRHATARE